MSKPDWFTMQQSGYREKVLDLIRDSYFDAAKIADESPKNSESKRRAEKIKEAMEKADWLMSKFQGRVTP